VVPEVAPKDVLWSEDCLAKVLAFAFTVAHVRQISMPYTLGEIGDWERSVAETKTKASLLVTCELRRYLRHTCIKSP
jgi:hypothetical protein